MKYGIVLCGVGNREEINRKVEAGQIPRNYISLLQQELNASFHMPSVKPNKVDKFLSILEGKAENWALARKLRTQLTEDDVIFCNSEPSGIPTASIYRNHQKRPRIISLFQNFGRPRSLISTKLLQVSRSIDLFVVGSIYQRDLVCRHLNLPESRVLYLPHHVDTRFFRPGEPSLDRTRPIIASVGLENRDYRLLAAATQDIDVDVRICDTSHFAKRLKRSFPDPIPSNMSCRFYDMNELVQLYRDANIFVLSVFESSYHAGTTALLEAMACRCPIIATKTKGLACYLDSDAILTVQPGDAEGLKKAILHLLRNPDEAKERAERAYQLALKQHSIDVFTSKLAYRMKNIHHDSKV